MIKNAQLYSPISADEISFNTCGFNFLFIVGEHINGGFIAILNWGLSAELSDDWNDTFYNANAIEEAMSKDEVLCTKAETIAKEIAVFLRDYYS